MKIIFSFVLFTFLCNCNMYGKTEDTCPLHCICRTEISSKRQIKSVTCTSSNGSNLPTTENLPSSVEVLRYTNNPALRKLDFFKIRFPSLISLEVCCNSIHDITGSGRTLQKLKYLDLSYNNLHILQQYAFHDFSELIFLNLSFNGLHTILPESLNLVKLEHIDLRHNRLSMLRSDYFRYTPSLIVIELSHNAIAAIPPLVFSNNNNLKILQLSNNKISRIDENAFEGLNISNELDLSTNSLRTIPSLSLKRIVRVDKLLLDSNDFRILSSGSLKGISARMISISKQKQLKIIQQGAFNNLPDLESLKISDNCALNYIPNNAISYAPHLTTIDLSSNSLYALENGFISSNNKEDKILIKHLNVSNNKFLCHCTLEWLNQDIYCIDIDSKIQRKLLRTNTNNNNNNVNCSPHILELFPDILTVELGSNVSFECRALALPSAKINWFNSTSRRISNKCNEDKRICVRDQSLVITFLHRYDQGQYVCEARNHLGITSRNITLLVKDPNVKLFALAVAAKFVTFSWNMTSSSSSSTNYVLHAISDLDPNITRTEYISPGPRTHSYTVHGLLPATKYTFKLCLEWDQYSIELTSIKIETQSFLSSAGIEFNYFAAIIFILLVSSLFLGCVLYWTFRCYSRATQEAAAAAAGFTPHRVSTLRKAQLFQSTSAHSDVTFITFIDISDDFTESNLQ